ncbi:MerR family transcriptional regulator [Rhizomicrobium electricum]|uniref:MerR family transcriptional regulator n=1 Tax=Rhizomicrobium electricum TaxID=480070 RepID=UPI001420851F|nr:MerR family transcriptional regulator [Rhizomicrobium electricum]
MSYAAVAQFPSRVKSPEAFRTISEVASELDVPQHVLRFWESRFTQVKPTKRAGGRRYYRPEDVDLLRGIRTLLYSDGYTIKGVQKLLKDRGVRYVAEIGRESIQDAPQNTGESGRRQNSVVPFERRGAALDEEAREKLEILLAELVQLKARMRTAPRLY